MNYTQLLQKLYSCSASHGMKLGLENSFRLNEALGFPDRKFQTIHVAGTNGKGSVSTKIAAALQASGLKVGLYTSPHIATFRERIAINTQMISEEDVSSLLQSIFHINETNRIPATFFEITTLLCLKYFASKNVDIAVIETGLGGRLDATNIITPLLSIITSISHDHTEILGNTIESIALEKAGIIKLHVPLIIGPRVPYPLINEIAQSRQSECLQVRGSFLDFEEENQAIAGKALEKLNISSQAISTGLKQRPLCRMQVFDSQRLRHCAVHQIPKTVILDVAHNADGLDHLFYALNQRFPGDKVRVVCGLSKSKDLESCLKIIHSNSQYTHLTEAAHPRAAHVEKLERIFANLCQDRSLFSLHSNVKESVKQALVEAANADQILLICGTFFIMAAARKVLGIVEPCDDVPF